MENKGMQFIIIDDSKLDCFIAEKIIRNAGISHVRCFMDARQVIDFIRDNTPENAPTTILLVDIQMPFMNGFEFMEAFEKFPQKIQDKYHVYILSSSSNENDLNRAKKHPAIRRYLNKPITTGALTALMNEP